VKIVRPLPGEHIQSYKALIHNSIEAFLFMITENPEELAPHWRGIEFQYTQILTKIYRMSKRLE
jgi:hypothetical protein